MSNLFLTTSRATPFSATKRTLLPWYRALVIIFAIVWLFPVPGGPSNMKETPFALSLIASIWLESAGRGMAKEEEGASSPVFLSESAFWVSSSLNPSTKEEIRGFCIIFSRCVFISFHITKRAKENKDTEHGSSSTAHPLKGAIRSRMKLKIKRMSGSFLLVLANSPKTGEKSKSKFSRKYSKMVVFKPRSSMLYSKLKDEPVFLLGIFTGKRKSGE